MRSIRNVKYVRQSGNATVVDAPNWEYIYTTSTVKDPDWNLGDRVVLPDGREFHYSKATSAILCEKACQFDSLGGIGWVAPAAAAAIGDTSVSLAAATHSAFTEDELAGGYALFFVSGNVQVRGIIGNSASESAAAITIYLDGPLTTALTTSHAAEVYINPYGALDQTDASARGKAGVAAVKTASGAYFWCQTSGPCFINPQTTVTGKEGTGCFFRQDGSLDSADFTFDGSGTIPIDNTTQYAGHVIHGTQDGNGPLFMLRG